MATVEPSGENQQEDAGPENDALDDMGRVEVDAIAHSRSLYLLEHPQSLFCLVIRHPGTLLLSPICSKSHHLPPHFEGDATSDIWAVVPEAHWCSVRITDDDVDVT
ncbi:hypothetical protein CBS147346_7667 [Aspergillus niger]|nr:hypothetical protein CBS147346_7667 [Aspergillus niger]